MFLIILISSFINLVLSHRSYHHRYRYTLNETINHKYLLYSNSSDSIIRVYKINTENYQCLKYKGYLKDREYTQAIFLCNNMLYPYFNGEKPTFYSLDNIIESGYFIYHSNETYNEYSNYCVFDVRSGCQHSYGVFYQNEFNFQEC